MIELIFLVPKQVTIGYFRNLEQGHFDYLNGGDPLLGYEKYYYYLYKKEMDLRLSTLMIVIGRIVMDM